MLKPLQDKIVVRLDESIASAAKFGLYVPPKVDAYRAKDGAIEGENRGTVVQVGPGKVSKYGVNLGMSVKPGDVVRFSELEYHSEVIEGQKHVLISEADVLWVEEPEDEKAAMFQRAAAILDAASVPTEGRLIPGVNA